MRAENGHDAYDDLINSKLRGAPLAGMRDLPALSSHLRAYQADVTNFGLAAGRWGCFLDTGLGKTLVELEWSEHARNASNGRALILTPLAVAQQIRREGERFGYPVRVIREQGDAGDGINICNYDRLHLLDPAAFGAVVLDESSILKDFQGKTFKALLAAFAGHRWKMLASATPAPNDHTELGQSVEWLGIMPASEMLMRWFTVDHGQTTKYRLRGHGEESFWDFVATWARMASHPRDLGHPEEGFDLPPLNVVRHSVTGAADAAGLFGPSLSATSIHDIKRQTASGRADVVAGIVAAADGRSWSVWCDTDYEQDAVTAALRSVIGPERILDVRGGLAPERKESLLERFAASDEPCVMVTKPSIAGWGLNWQHCSDTVFTGRSYSYEKWYQAVRRHWRYGQDRVVNVHLVIAEGEEIIGRALDRKARDHERMQTQMAAAMGRLASGAEPLLLKPYRAEYSGRVPGWLPAQERVACLADSHGERYALYNGDCVNIMRQLPDASVDLSVYSPPFAGIFVYSDSAADMGNCASDEDFLRQYRFAAEELYRVTRPGRLAAVHCKDLRNLAGVTGRSGLRDFPGKLIAAHEASGWEFHSRITIWRCPVKQQATSKGSRLNYKDLMRDATFSMVGLPEYLLVFRRWPDNEAEEGMVVPVAHRPETFPLSQWQEWASPVWGTGDGVADATLIPPAVVWGYPPAGDEMDETDVLGSEKGLRDEKHICPLPLDITRRVVRMWSNPGETVLSPYAGIGSEGKVSLEEGRRFIGAELKAGYFKQGAEWCAGVDRQGTIASLLAQAAG